MVACAHSHYCSRDLTFRTHRDKLLEADLLILVGVSCDEGLHDLSHLVPWQGQTCLLEQLLELEVAHIATVVNIWKSTINVKVMSSVFSDKHNTA